MNQYFSNDIKKSYINKCLFDVQQESIKFEYEKFSYMVLNSTLQPTIKKLSPSNFDIILKKTTHNYLKKHISLSNCISVLYQIFFLYLFFKKPYNILNAE